MPLLDLEKSNIEKIKINDRLYEVGQWIRTNEKCLFSYLEGSIIGFKIMDDSNIKIIVDLFPPENPVIRKNMENSIKKTFGINVRLTNNILKNRVLDISQFNTEDTTDRYIRLKESLSIKHFNCNTPKGSKCKKDRVLEKNKIYKISNIIKSSSSKFYGQLIYNIVDDKNYSYLVKKEDIETLKIPI